MSKYIYVMILFVLTTSFVSCNSKSDASVKSESDISAQETDVEETIQKDSEDGLKKFLYDTEGHYGWETTTDDISLDFLEDGRLHIQGPDGEATMWEGNWTLEGDQLTMERADLGTTQTVTVKIDGDNLVLGDVEYTRYNPMK